VSKNERKRTKRDGCYRLCTLHIPFDFLCERIFFTCCFLRKTLRKTAVIAVRKDLNRQRRVLKISQNYDYYIKIYTYSIKQKVYNI